MTESPILSGAVEGPGENPGMSLKETGDGPWVTLPGFFRVALSPRGRGHVPVMLRAPDRTGRRIKTALLALSETWIRA
ncbi:MAG: hypothetical protein HY521_13265 [Proteobacteria bacterium]|nr:hypothetical protein [Pseudomonadota bacterium]